MKTHKSLYKIFFVIFNITAFLVLGCNSDKRNTIPPNTLTKKEIKEGWKLLFDGITTKGWRGANMDKFPEKGWIIDDGCLIVLEGESGGDIVTQNKYSNFEFSLDFKYEGNSNCGFKYFVLEDTYQHGQALGLEYQLLYAGTNELDDSNFRTLGSLYDLLPAKNRKLNPTGEWNNARVVSKGTTVEHWLNGIKVLEYERGGELFRDAVAKSKFAKFKDFGEATEGHILIQYHHNLMFFRNIKIKEL